MRVIRVSAAILAGLYLFALGGLAFAERAVLYRPSGGYALPWSTGLRDVRETFLQTPDGNRLVAWYAPARPGQPTFLYLHGNAGNLAGRASRIARFQEEGWGVFMMSYRSFSGSSGVPSEADNVADAMLAYEKLRELGVPPSSIVAYGESLGTGVAVQMALRKPVAGVVLDAPYTSMAELAQSRFPIFPVRTVMRDRYETDRRIGQLQVPLLILLGEKDDVIPVSFGRRLAALAPEPKTLAVFAEGGHTNLPEVGGVDAVRDWLVDAFPAQVRAAWLPSEAGRTSSTAFVGEPKPIAKRSVTPAGTAASSR